MEKLLFKLLQFIHLKPTTIDLVQEWLAILTDMVNDIEAKELEKAKRAAEMADLHLERAAEHKAEATRAKSLAKSLQKA